MPDGAEGSVTPASARGQRILLVEDNRPLRLMLGEVLEGDGYRVLSAADADEALGLVATAGALDMLIADVQVPGMSGDAIARLVRTIRPGLGVLLISGHKSPAIEPRALHALGAGFLAKPFTPPELLDAVRRSLDGRP